MEKDHKEFPGATIVYDAVAPVFLPHEEKQVEKFRAQREEIRKNVFDPNVFQEPDEFRRFWSQLRDGKGEGVLAGEHKETQV